MNLKIAKGRSNIQKICVDHTVQLKQYKCNKNNEIINTQTFFPHITIRSYK